MSTTDPTDVRSGRSRIDRLDRDIAALVVIDAQNDFCHPEGLSARQGKDVGPLQAPLRRVHALIEAAHRYDVPVYLVQNEHTPDSDTPEWLERHPNYWREQNCQKDTWGAEFCGFAPAAGDVVVTKHRYSAFIGTTLESRLREAGRRSLLFAGFTTATCVESSLRDAVCLDFLATVVEDCCAAYDPQAHAHAIAAMGTGFGEVTTYDRIVTRWSESSAEPAVGTPAVGAAG